MIFQSKQEMLEMDLIYNYIIPIGIVIIGTFILYRLAKVFEFFYAQHFRKPLFNHISFKKKRLTVSQRTILSNEYSFYNNLSKSHQRVFEHRVVMFINKKQFIGKQSLEVTDQMKVLIASTATMLTFGFRKYSMDIIDTVIIYPKTYFSEINEAYHKGETNPQLKAIVFSWEDFKQGYKIGDDNLNLGIHEFGHAIHLNANMHNDISSVIFNKGYRDLTNYLQNHEKVRQKLIASKYFRTYAYTNQFEFFAVLLENFIETPSEFRLQFPILYNYLKLMLNFNFKGY